MHGALLVTKVKTLREVRRSNPLTLCSSELTGQTEWEHDEAVIPIDLKGEHNGRMTSLVQKLVK